jgi:hypothetical protein
MGRIVQRGEQGAGTDRHIIGYVGKGLHSAGYLVRGQNCGRRHIPAMPSPGL